MADEFESLVDEDLLETSDVAEHSGNAQEAMYWLGAWQQSLSLLAFMGHPPTSTRR